MNRLLAATLAVCALAIAGCGGDGGESADQEPDLVMQDFAFQPAELTAAAGDDVSWRAVNEDDAQHNITMEEFGVDTDLDGGSGALVEFTTEQPGNFAFFCKFHPQQMVGQLTVE